MHFKVKEAKVDIGSQSSKGYKDERFFKACSYGFVYGFIPIYFLVIAAVVRPGVLNRQEDFLDKLSTLFVLSFLILNIVGNMGKVLSSETKQYSDLKRYSDYGILGSPKWTYCMYCKSYTLGKLYHCNVISKCIGFHNKRYYIIAHVYLSISAIVASYYTVRMVRTDFGNVGCPFTVFNVIIMSIELLVKCLITGPAMFNPRKDLAEDLGNVLNNADVSNDLLFCMFNLAFLAWACWSIYWVSRKIVTEEIKSYNGVYAYDTECTRTKVWKKCFIGTFGLKWYKAMVWPFANSPINGVK